MIKLSELETHLVKIRKKNTELNVKCDQCDYVTDNVSNLVKHILSHEASEVCQYCHFVKMQIVKSSNVITGTQENVSTLETTNDVHISIFGLYMISCNRCENTFRVET